MSKSKTPSQSPIEPSRGRQAAAARRTTVCRGVGGPGRSRYPRASAELEAVALVGEDLLVGRHAGERIRGNAQIHRQSAADRNRNCHAGHRPGAFAVWCAGNGEELGERAPGGRHLRDLDAAHSGHGGHRRRRSALRLELCPAAGRRPVAQSAGGKPDDGRHGDRPHRPGGGIDADTGRGPGYADHDSLGEDAAHPGVELRGPSGQGIQPDRHGQQSRQGGERAFQRFDAAVQYRGLADARLAG